MGVFDRVELLIGKDNCQKLQGKHVAVFGIGGVGGILAEALVRSGVGEITVIDADEVAVSNLNRQIISTEKEIGRKKVEVIKERLLAINPKLKFNSYDIFYLPQTASEIDFSNFDYVADAVDTVTAKIHLIERAKAQGKMVISCMGTGGKLDPTLLKVSDIEKTSVCPLARVMRKELKDRGIKGVKVVYSLEQRENNQKSEFLENGKMVQPSMMMVPSCAGLIMASEIIKDLIEKD